MEDGICCVDVIVHPGLNQDARAHEGMFPLHYICFRSVGISCGLVDTQNRSLYVDPDVTVERTTLDRGCVCALHHTKEL
jgi:hypothetical protein